MTPWTDEICQECRELAFTCPCAKADNEATGMSGDTDQWYSDEALEKQRIVNEWPKDKPLPLSLIVGIGQPRTQPEQHERCVCCGLDARDECNGEDVDGKRYCGICYGRDHHRD